MLNKKEIIVIFTAIILISFLISFNNPIAPFSSIFLSILIIFFINISAKKIAAYYFDSEIEINFWEIKRYGFRPGMHFKTPFPAGVVFPLLSKIFFFPFKSFVWMAPLIFNIKAKTYRAAKRFDIYTFSEVSEYHIGLIAASGIIANLIFAIFAYLIGVPSEMQFVKLSIFFIFFNMIPFSRLDGNKIFFGSFVLWSFLALITMISLINVIIVI